MDRKTPTTLSLWLVVLVIVTIGASSSFDATASSISSFPEHLEIHGGAAEQRAIARWAADRFAQAGMEFPLPSIYLHEGTSPCGRNGGFTDVLPEGVTVHICVEDDSDLARKVLHELAHVWDLGFAGISAETRATFLAMRGLDEWNNLDDDWPDRGAEQAAEIIAWGLRQRVAPIPTRVGLVGPDAFEDLTNAFQLLAGAPPLWIKDVIRLQSVASTESWQDV